MQALKEQYKLHTQVEQVQAELVAVKNELDQKTRNASSTLAELGGRLSAMITEQGQNA